MCLAKKDAGCKGGQCTMVRVPSITQTANQVPQPRPPLRTCTLRRRRPFSASCAPPFSSDSPSACRNRAGACISKRGHTSGVDLPHAVPKQAAL